MSQESCWAEGRALEVQERLHTGDAHALYRKLGFDTPDSKLTERPPSGQSGSIT